MNRVATGFLLAQTFFCLVMPILAVLNFRFLRKKAHREVAEGELPTVSVCVPARNEALNVGACVASLVRQDYPDFEVLVLDDCSEDGTAEIVERITAEHPRVRLIKGRPLPEGWIGKSHACYQLGREATGEYVLFTDADTVFEPGCLREAAAMARAKKCDLLTGIPRMVLPTFWERVSVPLLGVIFTSLVPLPLLEWRRPRWAAAGSGAFLFFRR